MPGVCELVGTEPCCCWGPNVPWCGSSGCRHPQERRLRVQPDPGCLCPSSQTQPGHQRGNPTGVSATERTWFPCAHGKG